MHQDKKFANLLNTIETIEIEMMGLKIERKELLDKHEKEWRTVKRGGVDKTNVILELSRKIGGITHRINKLITSLLSYFGHEEIMKIAIDYLDLEIERNEGIYESRVDHRKRVELGQGCYIYPDGTITRNPRADDNYIATKKAQVERLKEKKLLIIEQMNSKEPQKIKEKIELIDPEEPEDDVPPSMPRL